MRKKLYIETSVWNQLVHDDRPDWKETAEKFVAKLKRDVYEACISDIVIREIEATKDLVLQSRLVNHINSVDPVILEILRRNRGIDRSVYEISICQS